MRKQTRILTLAASLTLATSTAIIAKPLGANLTLAGGKPLACYVISVEGDQLKYGLDENGSGPTTIPLSTVEEISLRTPDNWSEALGQYNGGDYAAAEVSFSGLAKDYAGIASIRDQYGALARYYELQCLKQNGKYQALTESLNALKTSPIALGEHYLGKMEMLKGWGFLGKEDWDGVLAFVASYEDAASQGVSPRMPFKSGISRRQLAELSFLRGYAKLRKEDREGGLEDLSGTVGLNFGSDVALTKAALTEMLKQFEKIDEKDVLARREAYSLAVYLKGLSGGVIDPAFTKLLDAPPMPEAKEPVVQEQPKAEPAEPAEPAAEPEEQPKAEPTESGEAKSKPGRKGKKRKKGDAASSAKGAE